MDLPQRYTSLPDLLGMFLIQHKPPADPDAWSLPDDPVQVCEAPTRMPRSDAGCHFHDHGVQSIVVR